MNISRRNAVLVRETILNVESWHVNINVFQVFPAEISLQIRSKLYVSTTVLHVADLNVVFLGCYGAPG